MRLDSQKEVGSEMNSKIFFQDFTVEKFFECFRACKNSNTKKSYVLNVHSLYNTKLNNKCILKKVILALVARHIFAGLAVANSRKYNEANEAKMASLRVKKKGYTTALKTFTLATARLSSFCLVL